MTDSAIEEVESRLDAVESRAASTEEDLSEFKAAVTTEIVDADQFVSTHLAAIRKLMDLTDENIEDLALTTENHTEHIARLYQSLTTLKEQLTVLLSAIAEELIRVSEAQKADRATIEEMKRMLGRVPNARQYLH